MASPRTPRKQTLVAATELFLKDASPWLTPSDAPAVATLRLMAESLDREYQAAMSNSYGLTYRNLLKNKPPVDSGEVDPLDDIIPS